MPTAEQIVASQLKLVTLPAIFARVKQVVEDNNATAFDLAKVVSADPALTARVLKLINSAFWGFNGQIGSLSRAVSLLGMVQVHDLVLSTSVAEAFDGMRPGRMNVAKFWRCSVMRGIAATALAHRSALVDLGRVFSEGLLSDLGHMVLYLEVPELAARAMEQAREQPWTLAAVERELIGCDFAQVGGALTDAWKLPQCFGAAIRHQLDPQAAGDYALEASLLHIAASLAEGHGTEPANAGAISRIAPFAWQTLGLTPDCLPEILAQVEANLSATTQMFCARAARAA